MEGETPHDVTFVAQWTPNIYTITVDGVAKELLYGAEITIEEPTKEGHTFAGWLKDGAAYQLPATMPAENLVLTSDWTVNTYILTVSSNDAKGNYVEKILHVPYGAKLSDYYLETPSYIYEGKLYEFDCWAVWTWETGKDETMKVYNGDTMPASDVTMYTTSTVTGWETDEDGNTTYYVKSDKFYYNTMATIDGAQYWFDGESYIAKDITSISNAETGETKLHAFDHETGKFLSGLTGIYEASNGDLYYVENGIAVANKGLVKVTDETGHIHYYYFGCSITSNYCPNDYQCDPYKAQKNCVHWVENNNGMLVKWDYTFDENGVIEHQDDTSLNGIQIIEGKKFYLIDGVKVHMGLFKVDGNYYYARSSGELVVGRDYWITDLNGLDAEDSRIKEGSYTFDDEGCMIFNDVKNGIYEEDGKLFYYVDGMKNYAGLIQFSGDLNKVDGTVEKGVYKNAYLYVRTSGELAEGRYWITKNNGLKDSKNYEFDSYGRMILTEGFQTVDGILYYYKDGNPYYAGLIEIDGSYYYVKTSGQVVVGRDYWITKTNGMMPEKSYIFDDSGKMLNPALIDSSKDGIVAENGSLFYYEDGKLTYAGLIEIDGNYYYVKTSGEVVHGQKYWITKNNGLMKSRSYTFGDDGVMLDPEPLA